MKLTNCLPLFLLSFFVSGCAGSSNLSVGVGLDGLSEGAKSSCDVVFSEWEKVDVEMVEFAQGVTAASGSSSQAESSEPWRILQMNAEFARGIEDFFLPGFNESEKELGKLARTFASSWEEASSNGTRFMSMGDGSSSQATDVFSQFAIALSTAGTTQLQMMAECQRLGYTG